MGFWKLLGRHWPIWTALRLLLAIGVAMSMVLPDASAAPGAIGGINYTAGSPEELSCYNGSCHFGASGWAYNPRTAPIQTVVLHFYDVHGTLLHVSGQYPADHYNINSPTEYRSYSWAYGPYDEPASWAGISQWRDVCAWAHDQGESGGYVSIGCQTIRVV